MENKTKIKTTPSIYQQPLENNRKIKTALTTNNQWKDKTKIKTTPTSIYQQPLKTAKLIINERQNKNKNNTNKYLQQPLENNRKI